MTCLGTLFLQVLQPYLVKLQYINKAQPIFHLSEVFNYVHSSDCEMRHPPPSSPSSASVTVSNERQALFI